MRQGPATWFFLLAVLAGFVSSAQSSEKSEIEVLVFLGLECPVSQKYMTRLNRLADKFSTVSWKGIVAENVNTSAVKGFAKEYQAKFSIVKDKDFSLAQKYSARVTPEVFVIKSGQLKYRGAIDGRAAVRLSAFARGPLGQAATGSGRLCRHVLEALGTEGDVDDRNELGLLRLAQPDLQRMVDDHDVERRLGMNAAKRFAKNPCSGQIVVGDDGERREWRCGHIAPTPAEWQAGGPPGAIGEQAQSSCGDASGRDPLCR